MKIAFTVLLSVVGLGILLRAFFSTIGPFGIILQSLRLLPDYVRRKWPQAVVAGLLTGLVPLAVPVASLLTSSPPARTGIAALWQMACTAGLALVAIRIHRGLVMREPGAGLQFGTREVRMVLYVLGVWFAVSMVSAIPGIALLSSAPPLVVRVAQVLVGVVVWLAIAATVYVGPAASFDDPAPLRATFGAVWAHPFVAAALVMLPQALHGLGGITIALLIDAAGISPLVMGVAVLITLVFTTALFIVTEHALAIALTRIRENVYDEDTRGRDYNADWH